jgi:putative transcriptional regulator|tara:strand:+ start:605 stop:826 length:222 start_codon:yes stop_codon:yes gene_type:complete
MKNRLKIERAILDLTQDELANKIGVSRQTISSIEKNRYVPSTVLALRLSLLFDKPVNDFFELEDSEMPMPNTV